MTFSDTDFSGLDVDSSISIAVTLGDLSDPLLNLEAYGDYLRGYDPQQKTLEDEPRAGLEPVLTVRLVVGSDLEPIWSLFSLRADAEGSERNLRWKDRQAIAPVRIGNYTASNLSWTRGSVLNRLADSPIALGSQLASAARKARADFGQQAASQLEAPLRLATNAANYLGISVGESAQALLDAHSVSISDGAIALHNDTGVPLRSLGTGSSRLLVAGLQRTAAKAATIALVDEVEYGLEPHRVCRLLDTLGAKDEDHPLQVFMTTHSPVVVRELSGDQVCIVRMSDKQHTVQQAGTHDEVQSTLRADPEAFLARSILVCEGASEVGLARGLDQFWESKARMNSFFALGGSYVNVGGGDPDKCFRRGIALSELGYRVMVLVDADRQAALKDILKFRSLNGELIKWEDGNAPENELFYALPDEGVTQLIEMAIEIKGRETIRAHIVSKSNGTASLEGIEQERKSGYSSASRVVLGNASQVRKDGWFKSLTYYQYIGRSIVGPNLAKCTKEFQRKVSELRAWTHAG